MNPTTQNFKIGAGAPAMKERAILFSAPMIRALLTGTKTQTRRIVKLPHENPLGQWEPMDWGGPNGGRTAAGKTVPFQRVLWHTRTGDGIHCSQGQPGDRLWVREAWRAPLAFDLAAPRDIPPGTPIAYQADGAGTVPHLNVGKLRPSMFMPRWASRITLEITGVRVERLQDISEADARAEGVTVNRDTVQSVPDDVTAVGRSEFGVVWSDGLRREGLAREAFGHLWRSINGDDSWAANPWVWCISFKPLEPAA